MLIKQILSETSKAVTAVDEGKDIVEKSTVVAKDTVSAMDTIVQGANDTLNLVMQVVDATEKQKESSEAIVTTVQNTVQAAEKITETTETSSAEAKEVLEQIDDVNEKFNILINSLSEMTNSADLIYESMSRLNDASEELINAAKSQRAAANIELQSINEIFEKTNKVFNLVEEQEKDVLEVSNVFESLKEITDTTITSINTIVSDMKDVGNQVSNLFGNISYFSVGGLVDQMRNILRGVKKETLEVIDNAIKNGIITVDDLFDRDYKEIPGTNPQKYHTRFDKFTDEYILPILDKYQASNENVVFVVLQDDKCYLPTHNSSYAKPLTGDYEVDLANNRTKRIFNDPVGSACSTNTEKEFLIQSYMRDNGDILFDISTPLYIENKHWGCIRLGFKL